MEDAEAQRAAEALGPEARMLAALDPLSFGKALAETAAGLARHPLAAGLAGARFLAELAAAGSATAARALGSDSPGPVSSDGGDRRFADPAWERNPAFFGLHQGYLLWSRYLGELVEAAGLPERRAQKAQFFLQTVSDALAPTNYLWTNPAALKRAFDTGGASLLRGFRNFLEDAGSNGGMPRQVDGSAFTLGRNLAATPGKVVFRNQLMELLQYAPQTETVYEIPLLCSPPWINKYYVMDLAPGRSFVEWAVQHGHTVFAISYRNPDDSLRHVSLDDYLIDGPREALAVMREITGAAEANVVGLCLGGTLTAMLLAYLAARGEGGVRSATLLNSLVDFSQPGPLGCFTDRESVARLERKMASRGFLGKEEMARTFDLLRANDLIWSYVASNWLMGEQPPAFDILAWNADSTRMPADMHSFYLECCYIENQLARGEMELAGTRLDPRAVAHDVYLVGADEDHIAPWRSCYATTQLVGGRTRFVLTSSGHIAGIVNPPGGKRRYWTGEELPPDPDAWRAGAREHTGTWWEDWTAWIAARSGERREPPPLGGDGHPPLDDAPGRYVLQK